MVFSGKRKETSYLVVNLKRRHFKKKQVKDSMGCMDLIKMCNNLM